MAATPKRFALLFGPYRTPRYRIGQSAMDEVRGEVIIVKTIAGRIPWPIGKQGRYLSPVVYRDLLRAINTESNQAVCYHWGITPQTVGKWRKALGISSMTPGRRELMRDMYREHGVTIREALRRGRANPQRAKSISLAKTGVPRSPETVAKIRQGNLGKQLSSATRAKMSAAKKASGWYPPGAGERWTAAEDQLVRTLPATIAAKRTGRTLSSVYNRRARFGIRNGRTTRHCGRA